MGSKSAGCVCVSVVFFMKMAIGLKSVKVKNSYQVLKVMT